jgi:hypothetical protein
MKSMFFGAIFAASAAGTAVPKVHAEDTSDSSGTNPAVLRRTASISNEYQFLTTDAYNDVTLLRYTEPLGDGSLAVRFTVPVIARDIPGGDDVGLGDISAKFTWVPHFDKRQAFILSGELFAPTAGETYFGSGKFVFAPGIVWANFISPSLIIAPAYVHNISIAGDDDRDDINRGDFDLYVVYKPVGERWWITSDVTVSYDFTHDVMPASWELSFGRNLAVLESGAALNGYIRPGIGLGKDRVLDYNIEVGLALVGF